MASGIRSERFEPPRRARGARSEPALDPRAEVDAAACSHQREKLHRVDAGSSA